MSEVMREMEMAVTAPARQVVQAGLGTTPDRGVIQSLWIEIPANCDLMCGYCFCGTRPHEEAARPDDGPDYLAHSSDGAASYSVERYVKNVLEPFAERIAAWNAATPAERIRDFDCPPENAEGHIRGKVAIPGSGEPFHPFNRKLTLDLIDAVARLDLHLTIFTTAHWIDDELAAELAPRDIVLLVKCNSMDRGIQNAFVGNPTHLDFCRERNDALDRLMRAGFNQPFGEPGSPRYQRTRLGIVTSVMNSNLTELPDLLRYARRNNIIFDCDTILERGRGSKCAEIPADEATRRAFHELQRIDAEEFGEYWEISRSYIGTTCDRFQHHLYVDKRGNILPCVGCLGNDDPDDLVPAVVLGNLLDDLTGLYTAWNTPLMRNIIRQHKYAGSCGSCLNYDDKRCYSCLGRCRDLSQHLDPKDGTTPVRMKGCWNNRTK